MSSGFLLNVALSETQSTSASPGFCKRVRFRRSRCQRCRNVCPESVISLSPGPIIRSGCTDCGLCQNVCPTEVFHDEVHTDQYLLNQAKALRGKDPPQRLGAGKKLFVRCHLAENHDRNCLLLLCLGRITANFILGTALLGFDEVVFGKGICSRCRYDQGERLLGHSIAASRVLLEGTGLDQFAVSIEEKERKKEAVLTRREVFSTVSSRARRKIASFMYHKEKAVRQELTGKLESKQDKRPSPKRALLRTLLGQKVVENAAAIEHKPEFPWGKIKIEERVCSACGTCVALCPTGALSRKSEDERHIVYFNSALCTNCSLCKEACPRGAIDFEEGFALTDILEDKAEVVATIKLTSCTVCGETIATQTDTLCPTCQKRQARPVHLKV